MYANCTDCNHHFLVTPDTVVAGACPNCGGVRLERDQPSPTHSDGELRNMVNPDTGFDEGGNPLQEGIWGSIDGGWQPHNKRDESFAHVAAVQKTSIAEWLEALLGIGGLTGLGVGLGEAYINGQTPRGRRMPPIPGPPADGQAGAGRMGPAAFAQMQLQMKMQPYLEQGMDEESARAAAMAELQGKTMGELGYGPHNAHIANSDRLWEIAHQVLNSPGVTLLDPESAQMAAAAVVQRANEFGMQIHPQEAIQALKLGWLTSHPQSTPYEDDTAAWEPTNDLYTTDQEYLKEPLMQMPPALQQRLPRQPNYGTAMNFDTFNTDPYPSIWVNDPSWDEDNKMRVEAGFLAPALPALGAAARFALPMLMRGAMMGTGSNMAQGLLGQGAPGGQPSPQAPPGPPQPRDISQLSHTAAGEDGNIPAETPTSNPGYYHDNPEEVDQHEFEDGSTSTNPANPTVDAEAGGSFTDVSNPGDEKAGVGADKPSFAADSPGVQRAEMLLPLLMHYHNSDQSGAQDPLIRELHELLDKEVPGYLESVGPEHAHEFETWLQQSKEPSAIEAAAKFAATKHSWQTKCPSCGFSYDPSFPACPKCGAGKPVTGATKEAIGPVPGPLGQQPGMAVPQGWDATQMAGDTQNTHQCPYCGGMQNADGTCPQCGAKAPAPGMQGTPQMQSVPPGGYRDNMSLPFVGKTAVAPGETQGPVTDEQKAAVSQFLIEAGRHDEIPVMLQQPWNYVDELAQVAGRVNVGPQLPQGQPPAQPPMPPGMDPGMMGAGATGGDPSAMMPPTASVTAADNVARRCPSCKSGTTGVLNRNGDCRCHACGYVWGEDSAVLEHISRTADFGDDSSNVEGVPAADQQGPPDTEQQQDSSLSWQDDQGQELVPGQQYEMHSAQYTIPDIVRVDQVKPDELVVTTIGEFGGDPNSPEGMQYQHRVSAQDRDMYEMTFTPVAGNDSEAGDQSLQEYDNKSQGPVFTEPINQHSHVTTGSSNRTAITDYRALDPQGQALLAQFDQMTPQQQQAFAVAQSMRMNNGMMQNAREQGWQNPPRPTMAPTPFEQMSPEEAQAQVAPIIGSVQPEEPQCTVCTSKHISSIMTSPTTYENECYKCGHTWAAAGEDTGTDADAEARAWLLSGGGNDDFFENFERIQGMERNKTGASRDIRDIASRDHVYQEIKQRLDNNKTAGKAFTQREQRDFIEENGEARNSDLLDLGGTHYEGPHSWESKGNAFNAPDDHLLFGL